MAALHWIEEGNNHTSEVDGVPYRVVARGLDSYRLMVNGQKVFVGALGECKKTAEACASNGHKLPLRAGNAEAPVAVSVPLKERTVQDVQDIVDFLHHKHGHNLPNWSDYAEILAGYELKPGDITDQMWASALENEKREIHKRVPLANAKKADTIKDVKDPTPREENKMSMVLEKLNVTSMFEELGFGNARKWSADKLSAKIEALPEFLEKDTKRPESKEGKETLKEILSALDAEQPIELVAGKKSEDDNGHIATSSEGNGDAPPKRKRGRPPKPKPEKPKIVLPEIPHHSFVYEELEPAKLCKLTPTLAKEFRDMTKFPRDRDLNDSRLAEYKQKVERGEFTGAQWVSCYVKEVDTTFRLNGKHTSKILADWLEAGNEAPCKIDVRRYSCPTMQDAAGLFATMDNKRASRTKADVIKGYSSAADETRELSPRILSILVSGLAFEKVGHEYWKRIPTDDQAGIMLENTDFAQWLNDFFVGKAPKKVKHVMRAGVVAAMYRTWKKDSNAALQFWQQIRDDSNDPKEAPTRRLFRWLCDNNVVGAGGRQRALTSREILYYCIKAWNAWRENEEEVKLTHYREEGEMLEVV